MNIILCINILLCISISNVYIAQAKAQVRIDPLVLIEQGLVRGQKASDGDYSTFLGIPYAEVDLSNPFGPSKQPSGFTEDIFEANNGLTQCPQIRFFPLPVRAESDEYQTLDCLTLNIFVPNEASTRNPMPVLVWIHGGGYSEGSAREEGTPQLVKQGIVVVTINYRLGPYGFLCTNSRLAPGNQGLKDQYEALRWIRRNIAAFGGNPYNVTLAGLSAGSASVIHHLYSNKEKLYNQVIAQSGVPQGEGFFVDRDDTAPLKLAKHIGYDTNDTESALKFLNTVPHALVIAAFGNLRMSLMPCTEPTIEGIDTFIDSKVFSFTNEKKIRDTPFLIGNTNNEISAPIQEVNSEEQIKTFIETKIKNSFNLDEGQFNKALNIVKHFYIGDEEITTDVYSELEKLKADVMFNHPIQRTITRLLDEHAGPIYEYTFSFISDSEKIGAYHADDLQYLFDIEDYYKVLHNFKLKFDENDELIRERITTLWANFIKFGNPTPLTTELLPLTWEPITTSTRPYLVIDTEMEMSSRVFKERMAFWDLFYETYGKYLHSFLA